MPNNDDDDDALVNFSTEII